MTWRIEALLAAPTTVYRLFNSDGVLLYVGIAVDWPRRRSQHAGDKPWWLDVADVKLAEYPCRLDAALAERSAIIAELPLYNRLHHPGVIPTAGIHGYIYKPYGEMKPKQRDALTNYIKQIGATREEAADIIHDTLIDLGVLLFPRVTTAQEQQEAKDAQRRRAARVLDI